MGVLNQPNIPNFDRRRILETPAVFVPPSKAFRAQKKVQMTRDVTGWVKKDKISRKKYHLNTGKTYTIDEDIAREWVIKGYAKAVGWEVVTSVDEIDEARGSISIINLGDG